MPEALNDLIPNPGGLSCAKTAASLTGIIDRMKSGAGAADDSYLIRLCGEFEAQSARYTALCETVGIEDGSPAHDAQAVYHDMLAEIKDIAPRTMRGFVAKARVVALVIRDTHEDLSGKLECLDFDQEIALNLAENLVMFGGAQL